MEKDQDWWGFWKDNAVRARAEQQAKAAGLVFYRATTHYLYFARQLQLDVEQLEGGVGLIIGLGKGFPLSPPQVHFATSFSKPSLKDYRDILVELVGDWQWEMSLAQVVEKASKLIRRLAGMKGQTAAIQHLGEFYGERMYDYSMLKELSQHNPFICFENAEEQVTLMVLSVTATHVLFFQPAAQPYFNEENRLIIPREAELTAMRLVLVAEIHSLTEVSHLRGSKNEYTLQFMAYHLRKMEYTRRVWRKTLNITRSAQFIECLVKEASHYGLSIAVEVGSVKPNSAEEGLLAEAARREQKLKHYFNKDSLLELIDCYQRLVEHYSAEGPPYQEIYVHKTLTLYNRPDVQLIISAHSPR